jgi:putative DNA methylase
MVAARRGDLTKNVETAGPSFARVAGLLPGVLLPGAFSLRLPPRNSHHSDMAFYERRLPHWDVIGQPMFVTFRLHGSLPSGRAFPPARLTSGQAFAAVDRLLDHATAGPLYLRQPEFARLVVQALRDGESRFQRYELHAFVVMPNHVHALVTPKVASREWLGPLKGFTGHEANRILGLSGRPFWQDESYDHLVRNGQEFARIQDYIECNPVKAGLAVSAEEYPWSSATPGGSPAASQKA